jgi:hypothetical protein
MAILLTHATVATMTEGYGLIDDAAVVTEGDRIAWIGQMCDLPKAHHDPRAYRLSQPHRLWRPSGGGVRNAAERGKL